MARPRRLSLIAALAMLASTVLLVGPSPAGACGGMETYPLETLDITVKPGAKVYKIGQTAKFKISIVRPAKNDPAGAGAPMPDQVPREAAADVNVGVGLRVGDVFLFGMGTTDANGEATIGVELKSYAPRGVTARADTYGYRTAAETTCANVVEYGYTVIETAFRTR